MRFRQKKWLLCLIGAGVMLGGFLLWYGFCVEPNLLVVRHYSMQAGEGRDSTDTPLRLVQISDLQLGENYSTGQLQKVVQRIQREQPDVLVFTGDLFEDYSQCGAELEQEVTALFSQLRAPLGKYAVWGNRDYGGGAEKAYRRILQAAGFTLLCNESVEISLENGEELLLCGLDDSLFGKPDGQPFLQQESKAYAYRILLLHEPDVAQLWSHSAFQLILAGHSHGGQVRLPFAPRFKTALARQYTRHFYTLNQETGLQLYVHTGLGTSHFAVRIGVPPEIAVFDIQV